MTSGAEGLNIVEVADFFRARDTIKVEIVQEMVAVAPAARVSSTAFFNHSFLPDVEIAWPGAVRDVYLRAYRDFKMLRMEVDALRHTDGVLYLWSLPDDAPPSEFVDAVNRARSLLVIERGALTALRRTLPPRSSSVVEAVLHVGQGLLRVADVAPFAERLIGSTQPISLTEALGPYAPDPSATPSETALTSAPHVRPLPSNKFAPAKPLRTGVPTIRLLPSERRPPAMPLRRRAPSRQMGPFRAA